MPQHDDPNRPHKGQVLRVSTHGPGDPPDPADAPYAVERLTVLSHELCGLLDGSMRCLMLARRSLLAIAPGVQLDQLDLARKHIETVHGAMERMADLVRTAVGGPGAPLGGTSPAAHAQTPLEETIGHAVEVLSPEAAEHGIAFDVAVSEEVRDAASGPIYAVLLNALRNAIDSIIAAGGKGRVEVRATLRAGDSRPAGAEGKGDAGAHLRRRRVIAIEVRDDGKGLRSAEEGKRAFEYGFSTKSGGAGVGLAFSREIVRDLGGTIELTRREDRTGMKRPGAVLRVVYPALRNDTIG